MKTLAETLRDADPLAYERRSVQERRALRQGVLDASQARRDRPQRAMAIASIVVLTIVGIALVSFQWSHATIDLVAAVRFEVHLAEQNPAQGLREAVISGTGQRIYLHPEAVVTNSDIARAQVVQGDSASTFGVSVTFTAEGGARVLRATQGHVGRPVAILIDGEVVAAPVVRSPITTSGVISGNYARAEAERIVGGIVGR
jgi:hypothetical protein